MTMKEIELVVSSESKKKYDHFIKEGIDPLIAKLLYKRGIKDIKSARKYLNPGVEDLYDPRDIRGIDKAIELISESIENEEKIFIFGDYDVDGITSTAIMYLTLKDLGADVGYRLPERLTEGYGMSVNAVKELHRKGCNLIITVDNGIKCHKEIELAKELGMKVIIIDHHIPGDTLPEAEVIIDLYVEGETYPFLDLAGCGLAFKVSCLLYEEYGFGKEGYKNLDLAAIGSVADVVELVDENRVIVSEGLKLINKPSYNRPGVLALLEVFQTARGTVTSTDIGFKLGPALNAPGRLIEEGADIALSLVISEDMEEANAYAQTLFSINEKRKIISEESFIKGEEYIEKHGLANDKVIVVFVPDVPEGVVGLVSGKLTEKYYRPTIVFSEGLHYYKASARSIKTFDLFEALKTCDDLFLAYGGHSQAAGMSIEKSEDVLKELRRRLNEHAEKTLKEEDLIKTIYVDQVVKPDDINFDLMDTINVMEPFGQGNPKPIFYVEDYNTVKKNKGDGWLPYLYMGEKKNHLKLYGESADIVGFDMVDKYEKAGKPRRLSVAFTLGANHFLGRTYLQMEMVYFTPVEKKEEEATDLMSALDSAFEDLDSMLT